ncbi:MAG: PAS domain S-box protein, partial [Ectothiorhodospiraceae bacterium]|nr:PAS domain S-box protein [Ectothiorhodospiraceae bacterium]
QAMSQYQVEIPQDFFLSAHSLLEILSIAVSALIFFVAFGASDTERSLRVTLLGCFFLAAALLDAVHLLSYPGMPDLITPNSADKMIWFWLAARISAALGLMSYALLDKDRPADSRTRGILLVATLMLFLLVFVALLRYEPALPVMHVPGEGLTPLKIALEWLIVGMLLLTAVALHGRRHRVSDYHTGTLILAVLLMAAGELFFTVYVQVSSTANVMGHVYKVVAYYYLYRAIFAETVRRPFLRAAELNRDLERQRDLVTGMLNTAPVIILLLATDGRIRHVNPYFERLTGFSLNELQGRDWFEAMLPERDHARIRELFARASVGQPARGNVNPIVTKGGEERDIEWHDQLMRDANGDVQGLLVIGLDVTERRLAQERAEMLQRLTDNSPQPIGWATPDGTVRYLNASLRNLLAVPDGAEPGQFHVRDFYDEAGFAELESHIESEVLIKGQWQGEFYLRALDGRRLATIHNRYCLRDSQEEIVAMANLVTDLTELQRIQKASDESESRYRLLYELSNDGIIYADAQSTGFVAANPRFAEMVGYPESYVPRLSVSDIHPKDSLPWVLEQVRALAEGSLQVARDVPVLRRDGSVFYADINASRVSLNGRSLLLGTFRDVTQRKREAELVQEMNRELEARVRERTGEMLAAKEEAERSNQAKTEFLSRMSHELRTPLNAILGFCQLIESEPDHPLSELQEDNLREILQAGKHLLALVNEVLDLAALEKGGLTIRLKPVAVVPVVEACIRQIQPLAAKRKISVGCAAGSACSVIADQTRLREVLLNLLSNAVKYNRDGGGIEARCEPVGVDRVRIEVQDTGQGIEPEAIARLFRPFERLESPYEGIEGTGIGLALTRELVRLMDGDIGVASTPGVGSTFWFELPRAGGDPADDAFEHPAPS